MRRCFLFFEDVVSAPRGTSGRRARVPVAMSSAGAGGSKWVEGGPSSNAMPTAPGGHRSAGGASSGGGAPNAFPFRAHSEKSSRNRKSVSVNRWRLEMISERLLVSDILVRMIHRMGIPIFALINNRPSTFLAVHVHFETLC